MQQPFAPINTLGGLTGPNPLAPGLNMPSLGGSKPEDAEKFANVLGNSLEKVNKSIEGAITTTDGLLRGDMDNFHDMTIAGAKAEVMMKLTTTVTSKLAQAVTQLFQMQV